MRNEGIVKIRNQVTRFFYGNLLKPIFFKFEPETVHDRMILTGRLYLYTSSIPKNGGEIKGATTGACVGSVTGQIQPQNVDKESNFTGLLDAKCTPMVEMSWKIGMKANLEGIADFKSGKIQIIYIFSEPYSFRGAIELYFTP